MSLGVPVGEAYGVVLDLEGRPPLRRAGMARLGKLTKCERAFAISDTGLTAHA